MRAVSSYDFAVDDCLLSEDVTQVPIPAVRHDGFSHECFFHLLVDVEDWPVFFDGCLQIR